MVLRGARYRGWSGPGWPAAGLAGLTWALALVGCSPIESYRSLTGVARNDPDPATAPFTQNLAAGEIMAYPNLATVPPPPTRATSAAERQQLTQTLIAERTDTQSDAIKGLPASPPPTGKPAESAAAKPTGKPAESVAAKPAGEAAIQAAAISPAPAATSADMPAAPPAPSTTAHALPELGHRPARQPAEPPPQESSLQMPQVSMVPEPEKPRSPLPPPHLPGPPPIAAAPPTPPPETVVAGTPVPPPPVPVITDVPPPSSVKPLARRPVAPTLVAALDLPGTPPRIDGDARAQIQRVAALYNEQPRPVRVVAYAAAAVPGAPGGEPLASYHAALERAQAVAAALRAAGIPADKVQAEASPAAGASPPDRIEIQLMP
jgi:hypothetical protein